jgi:molecular chaperone GrpE
MSPAIGVNPVAENEKSPDANAKVEEVGQAEHHESSKVNFHGSEEGVAVHPFSEGSESQGEALPEISPSLHGAPIASEISRTLELIQSLVEGLQALQQSFDSKIKYDTSKERIIDSLHHELQDYREGLHFQILRPIFFDLIGMHDDLTNLLKHNSANMDENDVATKLRRSLISFQETIESVLEHHGVIAFAEVSDRFVAQRQRAIRTEIINDSSKDRLICERVRKGFEYEGKVLRPETVVIYKYVESPTTQN